VTSEAVTWSRSDTQMQIGTATIEGGGVTHLEPLAPGPDPALPSRRPRLLSPQKRVGDRLESVSWEAAIREIGERMRALKAQGSDTAMLAGPRMGTDSYASVRAMATQFAMGPACLHTHLADHGAPWVRAAELVIGHPVALQADVARAHYAVVFGANQSVAGWGPLQVAPGLDTEIAMARKVKSTKLIAAGSVKTPLAASADQALSIRPGTELWFLLGMTRHILDNNWRDVQYTDDWTIGLPELVAALAPWTVERCADICGVPAGDLGGVALKFSRAAMAVAHLGYAGLRGPHPTLAAWASLVLHAVTANLLRPGAIYENRGVGPTQALLTSLGSEKAPRVGGMPMLLAQASAHLLPDRILTPGHGQVRGLLALTADPATELCGSRVEAALRALDLLVVVDTSATATSALAHFVLPTLCPFEREDVRLLDTVSHPRREAAYTPALVAAPGEARSTDSILRDVYATQRPALKSPFGPHVRLKAGLVIRGETSSWFDKALSDTPARSHAALKEKPWDGGDVDRATWRLSFPDNRFRLVPPPIADALVRLEPPRLGLGQAYWLQTSLARDSLLSHVDRADDLDPGVGLHPDSGFAEGEVVTVSTRAGSVRARVRLDPAVRPDTADLPAGYAVPVGRLIPDDVLDPFVGTPAWDGLGCSVTR